MNLADRLRRWWSPAQWRDEHPGAGPADAGRPLSAEERLDDRLRDRHGWQVNEDLARRHLPRGDDR